MTVIKHYLTQNRYSRNGKKINPPKAIVVHNCTHDGYSAIEERNFYEGLKLGKNAVYYSTHYIVGLEGEIISCIPETEISYHRSDFDESDGSISIAYCSKDKTREPAMCTLNSLKTLCAEILKRYDLNPLTDVRAHFDIVGKKCPFYYFNNKDKWRQVKEAISEEMAVSRHLKSKSAELSAKASILMKEDKDYLKSVIEGECPPNILLISSMLNTLLNR